MKYKVTVNGPDLDPTPHIIDTDSVDAAEAAVREMYKGQRIAVQVEAVGATSVRTAPHIRVALPAPKGKRHKVVAHNVSKEFAGNAIALYRRDKETGEWDGELGLSKVRHRGTISRPLPNALGFKSPVAEANKARFVPTPRRTHKGVLDMATKGHRVQYQGNGVWGHENA